MLCLLLKSPQPMDSLCSGVQVEVKDCRAATQASYEVRPTYEDMALAAGNFKLFQGRIK